MTLLFFDTETTGLPSSRRAADDERQPHCVQLAALLTDEQGVEISSINVLVKPDGWTIPSFVSRIHGITTEKAARFGVREVVAAGMFYDLACQADRLVGHNVGFDCQILTTMFARAKRPEWTLPERRICTMKAAAPLLNIPPTLGMRAKGMTGPKSPRLEECVSYFLGEKLKNAHDAMADVRACKEIYFCMRAIAEHGAIDSEDPETLKAQM